MESHVPNPEQQGWNPCVWHACPGWMQQTSQANGKTPKPRLAQRSAVAGIPDLHSRTKPRGALGSGITWHLSQMPGLGSQQERSELGASGGQRWVPPMPPNRLQHTWPG
jgi:hypothetical protein